METYAPSTTPKEKAIGELTGSVLVGDTSVLDTRRQIGFSIEDDPDDSSVRKVTLNLRGR